MSLHSSKHASKILGGYSPSATNLLTTGYAHVLVSSVGSDLASDEHPSTVIKQANGLIKGFFLNFYSNFFNSTISLDKPHIFSILSMIIFLTTFFCSKDSPSPHIMTV